MDFNQGESLILTEGIMAKTGPVTIQEISLNKIKLSKNSRMSISKDEPGLMESIKEIGLLQPIGLVKHGTGYEICYGNRRFLACSKLGHSKIPAIIQDEKKASDIDVKNLAENVQRRNISLAEVGRYVEILKKDMSTKEMAVRLGVSASYIKNALGAYAEVPEKYREDLEVQHKSLGKRRIPGKISIRVANAIINVAKTHRLNKSDKEKLFEAAKHSDGFMAENIQKYAQNIKSGHDDFVTRVKPLKTMHLNFVLNEDEYDQLKAKYVDGGPFRSVSALCVAILKGEKSVKFSSIK